MHEIEPPIHAIAAETMRRFEELGGISDEPQWLTRAYGTPALREAQNRVEGWMNALSMVTWYDSVGNLCGRLDPNHATRTLVFGGHLDTVRNAGKYDGTLGVLAALAALEAVGQQPLPFAVEVIAFADEESLRFPTMYLGSTVWSGAFDPALLVGQDPSGVTLEAAVSAFGGDPAALRDLPAPRDDVLAFIELHIEQGPVLEARDAPLGIVSAIAGADRFSVTITGEAGHAGTVPMGLRKDALAAAAEGVLATEQIGRATEGLVATVGALIVAPGAKNVIPGSVTFSLDIRHADDAVRAPAVANILDAIRGSATAREVDVRIDVLPGGVATPMNANLIATWERLFADAELEPIQLPSGAGHDAVAVSAIAPVSMLFLRCERGISHNPAEAIDVTDLAVGIDLLRRFLIDQANR